MKVMIAGSGFTVTRISDIFRDTVRTTSTSLERLADAMYEVALTMDRLTSSLKELKWIDIIIAWWAYVQRLTESKSPRAKKPGRVRSLKPEEPTDYG